MADFTLVKDSKHDFLITVSDENGTIALDAPVGRKLIFTLKKSVDDTTALITKTTDTVGEIDIETPQSDETKKGRATLKLTAADTKVLAATTTGNELVGDIWLDDGSSERRRVLPTKTFKVEQPVTRFV